VFQEFKEFKRNYKMLIVIPDTAGVLRDSAGQAYNEEGQKIDEQGNLIPEIADGVDLHQLGVARHQEEIKADGRRMTLGDYNRPDLFYSNRSAIRPPTFERSDFEINPALYTLVSMHPFHGLSQEHPMDHIERFEDLVLSIKAEGVSYDYLPHKLFPYSLAGEASSWLKQLKPGSLTTWKEINVTFLNNFFNDARSEELRMEISTFSQEATEAFKAVWIRFRGYQRDCLHHGFNEVQLLGLFFKGVDWRYQMALNAVSTKSVDIARKTQVQYVAQVDSLATSEKMDQQRYMSFNQQSTHQKSVQQSTSFI